MSTTTAALFTPPKSCSTTWIDTGNAVYIGARCTSGTLNDDDSCNSLGTITNTACPYNWAPVATASSSTTCCPSEFALPVSFSGRCYSSAGAVILEGITCAPGSAATPVTKTYPFTPGVYAVAVIYKGRTTSPSFSQSATYDSTLLSTSPRLSATSSATSPPSVPSPRPALSGGAIAGIVIGAIAVLILIITTIMFFRKRHRKSGIAPDNQPASYPPNVYQDTKVELDATTTDRNSQFSKAMSQQSHLVPFGVAPIELEDHNQAGKRVQGT
ncbi:hypothetical protein FB567DRAFT_549403 [Paraphoma chrysanthemicola]|uniref:Uncharacterized protein n=1 Tax=Paraphoma chrysanthemicola TaxID=798071 RepID=A0A8K0VXR1_9PLEO|nr:hypothetical protein FB567DRAFT_549403 [Paraphoma chrysanthemicola]